MEVFSRQIWVNFLGLIPGTSVTVLVIAIAFLRFYDEKDFRFLSFIAQPQLWSNRLTVAVLLAALANFGVVERSSCVAWNRRNREGYREAEAREQEAQRDQLQIQCLAAQIRHQLEPNTANWRELELSLAQLEEYRQTLDR